jgi:hypothetical protein
MTPRELLAGTSSIGPKKTRPAFADPVSQPTKTQPLRETLGRAFNSLLDGHRIGRLRLIEAIARTEQEIVRDDVPDLEALISIRAKII